MVLNELSSDTSSQACKSNFPVSLSKKTVRGLSNILLNEEEEIATPLFKLDKSYLDKNDELKQKYFNEDRISTELKQLVDNLTEKDIIKQAIIMKNSNKWYELKQSIKPTDLDKDDLHRAKIQLTRQLKDQVKYRFEKEFLYEYRDYEKLINVTKSMRNILNK